ncbi:MAG: YibE/F family protein [Bacteroidota bacterium]
MNAIRNNKLNIAFAIVISSFSAILWYIPTGFENPNLTESTDREKAEVIDADNSDISVHGLVTVGTQEVTLLVKSGRYKGDTLKAENVLMGQMKIDKLFKTGDDVLAVIKRGKSGDIIEARADDLYRIDVIYILFFLFAIFLIGFARWTGFKALLSFVFTALAIWKLLIPLFLKGWQPLLLSFVIVSAVTAVIILLITGFGKKGAVALSGSIAGIGITTLMALIFGHFFRIPGTVLEYSETLLYAGFMNLDLSAIFISAIFISAAGAVMDVAMDISASQNELILKKPEMTTAELIKSGFHIAYPVIGTMTTTLLFAYSGSFMFVFMVFMAKGTPMVSIFNTNYIAAEILHTLVGSFGLVLVAPITAIIGGYIYTKK